MGDLNLHEEMKKRFMKHPEDLGLDREEILEVKEEVELVGEDEFLIAKPDIVMKAKGGETIFIEVKSGWHEKTVKGLKKQLKVLKDYVARKKIRARIIGVHPVENGGMVVMGG